MRPHVPWYVPKKWFDRHPLEQVTRPPYRADDLDDVPETTRRIAELPMMPTVDWMEQQLGRNSSLHAR